MFLGDPRCRPYLPRLMGVLARLLRVVRADPDRV